MAKIISDSILYGSQFAEYYTGKYFFKCDTFEEVKNAIASEHIYIGDGEKLSNIPRTLNKAPKDAAYVIVQFAKEEDYTQHEYRLIRIQTKYLKRFTIAMQDENL